MLTDAVPTVGKDPEKDTLDAVAVLKAKGVSLSVIGIGLEKKGRELAKKMVGLGEGKLYMVSDVEEMDKIVLEDYYENI